jgi:ABC-type Mn2+/Zn2+ transport system ATPase subunit
MAEAGEAPLVLELDALSVRFGRRTALEAISLGVRAGDRVAVVGPNGAGKSTLFHAIIGLVEPTEGSVRVHGHAAGRDTCVAFVPQQSTVDWSFPLTVRDVVMMGRTAHVGWLRRPGTIDRRRVAESLATLRLEPLADRRINELSGGQRQRMFIARALAQDAHLVLLDEPFRGLDAPSSEDVFEALDLLDARGVAVLLATHDLRQAAERFGRLLLLNRRVVAWGPPAEVVTDAHLLEAYGEHVRLVEAGRARLLVGDLGGHGAAGTPADDGGGGS